MTLILDSQEIILTFCHIKSLAREEIEELILLKSWEILPHTFSVMEVWKFDNSSRIMEWISLPGWGEVCNHEVTREGEGGPQHFLKSPFCKVLAQEAW